MNAEELLALVEKMTPGPYESGIWIVTAADGSGVFGTNMASKDQDQCRANGDGALAEWFIDYSARINAVYMNLTALPRAEAGMVMVDAETIRWLLGEGDDFECKPEDYFRGKPTPYFWRKRLRAAIKPAPSLPVQLEAWRPISEAPMGGTHFLGWNKELGVRETHMKHYQKGSPGYAIWESGDGPRNCGWDWYEPIHNWSGSWKPTHWMPLPAPPALKSPHSGGGEG